MNTKSLCFVVFFVPTMLFGQIITGRISDKSAGDIIVGARVESSDGQKIISNFDGEFVLKISSFPVTLITTSVGYENDTTVVEKEGSVAIKMTSSDNILKTVVVSAGRRKQEIEEVPISMEILKPDLIDSKGFADLEQAVDQSPGVYAMDGQVSIRGGSGFAYGVGSRVMLLWNNMPLLTGDIGDIKFNSIPMENASQIEVIKGASSVLYGSGALNGVIALTEREPTPDGELRVKLQAGIYDNPKRSSLRWWNSNPVFGFTDVYYGKMYKRFGFTLAANGYTNQGFRQGETESRGRIGGTVFFRPQKISNLKAGIGYNFQWQKTGLYLIWESDSLAYTPSGGADTSNAESTLIMNRGYRFNVDPYLKFVDKKGNVHNLRTRVYFVDNFTYNNPDQANSSTTYFGDYQFQNKNRFGGILTTGLSTAYVTVNANLYGNHNSLNPALYLQYEHKLFNRLTLTGGVRAEYFEQNGRSGDSDFYMGKDSLKIPLYPIFRAAANYKLFKATFLRASFGQGVRYPSVAERYTFTNVGALNIFPNENLQRETGWAAELGVRQVFRIGTWKGIFDLAGFINQYSNMVEFAFGAYNPDDIPLNFFDPDDPGYVMKWVGFRAENAEEARISGIEVSFNSEGKIGDVELRTLLGYTYMNPISLNADSTYRSTFSDTTSNVLKYRFNHLVKGDVEAVYKGFSLGVSCRYNSFMKNIDKVFEETLPGGTEILPGLKGYREENNKGNIIFDARVGYNFNKKYRVNFMVNNFLNEEYMTRPGDIQAPRHYMLQFMLTL